MRESHYIECCLKKLILCQNLIFYRLTLCYVYVCIYKSVWYLNLYITADGKTAINKN